MAVAVEDDDDDDSLVSVVEVGCACEDEEDVDSLVSVVKVVGCACIVYFWCLFCFVLVWRG